MNPYSLFEPPVIWPDRTERKDFPGLQEILLKQWTLDAVELFCLVWDDPWPVCIQALELLRQNPQIRIRLILGIDQTISSKHQTPARLYQNLAHEFPVPSPIRIYPTESQQVRTNLLAWKTSDGATSICIGSEPFFESRLMEDSSLNLLTPVSAATFEVCEKWIESLWEASCAVAPAVMDMFPPNDPSLDLAHASSLWKDFIKSCRDWSKQNQAHCPDGIPTEQVPEPTATTQGTVLQSSPVNLQMRSDRELTGWISRLYSKGYLVTLSKVGRSIPFEATIDPEWFGLKSFQQEGAIKSKTSFRVSPFPPDTLRKLERARSAAGTILAMHSFPLADGVRWIPRPAIPLLQAALAKGNAKVQELLGTALDTDLDGFLRSRESQIKADAQRMYSGFHPGKQLPEDATKSIMEELRIRLNYSPETKLLPIVSYAPISFQVGSQENEWSSPWDQAFLLMKSIAEFPRKAIADESFWRGKKDIPDCNQYLEAMALEPDRSQDRFNWPNQAYYARLDLELIREIEYSMFPITKKCHALKDLMISGDREDIRKRYELPKKVLANNAGFDPF